MFRASRGHFIDSRAVRASQISLSPAGEFVKWRSLVFSRACNIVSRHDAAHHRTSRQEIGSHSRPSAAIHPRRTITGYDIRPRLPDRLEGPGQGKESQDGAAEEGGQVTWSTNSPP